MAGMRKKGDGWHCTFRFRGKRFYFAVGNLTEAQAQAKSSEVDETLDLLERGRLTVPDGVSLEDFVAAGGKAPVVSARPETITARQLFDHYLKMHGNGTIEASSLSTAKTHLNQLAETFGERFRIQSLMIINLQEHVDRRRKKSVAAVTIKKEVASLRACWNWATHGKLVEGIFPAKGLRFPKEEEKEPFRTFAEIEAIIAAENPDDDRKDSLWQALYLTRPELEEFLAHVRRSAMLRRPPFESGSVRNIELAKTFEPPVRFGSCHSTDAPPGGPKVSRSYPEPLAQAMREFLPPAFFPPHPRACRYRLDPTTADLGQPPEGLG